MVRSELEEKIAGLENADPRFRRVVRYAGIVAQGG
jgi:hypothetical protein